MALRSTSCLDALSRDLMLLPAHYPLSKIGSIDETVVRLFRKTSPVGEREMHSLTILASRTAI